MRFSYLLHRGFLDISTGAFNPSIQRGLYVDVRGINCYSDNATTTYGISAAETSSYETQLAVILDIYIATHKQVEVVTSQVGELSNLG